MKKIMRIGNVLLGDVIGVNLAFILAFWLHSEGQGLPQGTAVLLIVVTAIKLLVFHRFSLYSSLWEYASIEELMKVVGGVLVAGVFGFSFLSLTTFSVYPGVYLIAVVFEIALIGGNRFSYRILRRIRHSKSLVRQDEAISKVLIIGSGSTASLIATEIKTHPKQYGQVVGYICDDENKCGKTIAGVKVLGNRYDILSVSKRMKVTEIIVAIPTATQDYLKDVLDECKRTGAKVRLVPGILEVIEGHVSMNAIRDVEIEDLLGRDPVDLNIEQIASYIKDKTIMVTGGGGSIGSEICRQMARFSPRKLIVLDIYENNAYDIQNELKNESFDLEVLIASVRDKETIEAILMSHKPHVIFHAAAHKHVPLMERSPKEAIKNNVLGTLNVAQAAANAGVDRFVLISTDKAVNPTNVMGASKRLCEMIVQSMASVSKTKFVAVRFGNVLGSNGSVIPLFKKQIKEGGPITVTHKDIIRYFMTIPEAAQLVIQAGAIANGGEIFVLDMGEPVKIYNLAEDLIRLSGLKPHEDIAIKVTGLRPGEKLFEELLMAEEGMSHTGHKKIHIGAPLSIDYKTLKMSLEKIETLMPLAKNQDMVQWLRQLVPTYRPFETENAKETAV